MTDPIHEPSPATVARAHADAAKYAEMYAASIADPTAFWGEHGKRIDWITPYTRVKNTSFDYHNVSIRWFEDGKLNVSANCIDRHLATRANQTAIIWESDDPAVSRHVTYQELHDEVSKFGNVLHGLGVKKGDRVVLYLPMIPEAAYAMLACTRIGAVHSIVFAGFSAEALRSRIEDSGAKLLITADEAPRGGRNTPLKANADKALDGLPGVRQLVVRRTGARHPLEPGPRRLAARGDGPGFDPLRAGGDGGRGPAVHPLHLGLDRQAEGRAPHHGRLSGLRLDDPPIRLRLPRRRRLLVHRGRRLGDRAQLHRLRPALERRDHADVRGRARPGPTPGGSGRSAPSTR